MQALGRLIAAPFFYSDLRNIFICCSRLPIRTNSEQNRRIQFQCRKSWFSCYRGAPDQSDYIRGSQDRNFCQNILAVWHLLSIRCCCTKISRWPTTSSSSQPGKDNDFSYTPSGTVPFQLWKGTFYDQHKINGKLNQKGIVLFVPDAWLRYIFLKNSQHNSKNYYNTWLLLLVTKTIY